MSYIHLKELRIEKELSQAEVAEFLCVSRQAYNFYETGRRKPDSDTLQKLASLFEVSVDYLIDRTEDRNYGITADKLPDDTKDLLRDIEKLTKEQKEIVKSLVKEFVDAKKSK